MEPDNSSTATTIREIFASVKEAAENFYYKNDTERKSGTADDGRTERTARQRRQPRLRSSREGAARRQCEGEERRKRPRRSRRDMGRARITRDKEAFHGTVLVEHIHRFYVPVRIGTELKTIRIVAEEQEGVITLMPADVNVYDVLLEDVHTNKGGSAATSTGLSPAGRPDNASSDTITIREMLAGVKDADGKTYYQQHQESRGQIQGQFSVLQEGSCLFSLFEAADESTFLHETAHIFYDDLARLAPFDEETAEDLAEVDAWASWYEGAAKEYEDTPWAMEFAARERAIEDAGRGR